MIRVAPILIAAVSAALLGGMMLTNPDYNSIVRPFETRVPPGETGQTRLIGGRIEGLRTADVITFPRYGSPVRRETQGVFLIVDAALFGTTESTMLRATWIGASGRLNVGARLPAVCPFRSTMMSSALEMAMPLAP